MREPAYSQTLSQNKIDACVVMDTQQGTVSFDDVWTDVEKRLSALLIGDSIPRAVWNQCVLDVYHLCLSPRLKLGERLYQEIRKSLASHISLVAENVYGGEFENILTEYEHYWRPFISCVPFLDHLFSFLNTQVIRRHKRNQVDITYILYGVSPEDDMLEIGELALDLWRRIMIEMQQQKLSDALLSEITRDRLGQTVNHRAARSVMSSLIDVLRFRPAVDEFKLYEEVLEVPFFQKSTIYYIQMSHKFLESQDCSEFMKQVIKFTSEEVHRSRNFLHRESYNRVLFDCRQHLLVFNIPFLDSNCRDTVQREKWEDLSNMYQLLGPTNCPLENSLDLLVGEFEDHLQDIGLAVMQSLQGNELANQFVDAMLEFRSKYAEQIRLVFDGNQRFLAALDKACTAAINYRRHSKASCRSPELLAKYCDNLLKKTAKSMNESEQDDKLTQVIQLFNYISDKDIFEKFYSRGMAKRLIYAQFQSMDLEEAMINRLKQVCGYEYANKLHRMFTDMAISADLNTKFSSYLSANSERQLTHSVVLNVLAAGSWPISQSDLATFSLPQELEKCVRMFEMFYNEQYCGRKLSWMYNLSLVELKFCYCKKPYVVTMELYMMGVLICFNNNDTLNYRDIRENCQLPNKELLKELQLLVDAKMLLAELPITDSSVFTLNLKFTNKRTKFKVLPVLPAEVVQEVVQTHVAVEEDRRMFMQASIVRIMKTRKEMSHTALVQEVISQAQTRFMPKISTVKKCIENLLEKQYIERSPKTQGSYVYVA